MPYFNTERLDAIPEHLKGVMEYYPDVILFRLNQIRYNHLWQRISTASYLYSNGYEIRPVSWFMYAFQFFKGWLGFDNHCHPEKISYTLNKLAYYGYTRQFTQPDFSLLKVYSLSPVISTGVVKEYNDATTAQLQNELVKSFFKVEPLLGINYPYQRLNSDHRFGESWLKAGIINLIPQLDPQDGMLIAQVIRAFEHKGYSAAGINFIRNSKYARAAAHYFCDKVTNTEVPNFFGRLFWSDPRPSYLAQALEYDPQISKQHVERFIEFHLGRKEYTDALNLIELLSDNELALNYLLKIPEIAYQSLIHKDTRIAALLAKYYIDKKQLSLAQQYYSDIEQLSPGAAFTIAIQEKMYVKAYEIFKRQGATVSFPMSERKFLAVIFSEAAETEYDKGRVSKEKQLWDDAEQHYFRSLIQKKTAYQLCPSEEFLEDVYVHKRLYANLLIDKDMALYQPEESDIASIQKAITLLKECSSSNEKEKQYNDIALTKGLMRRVNMLREKICFTYGGVEHSEIALHKIKYKTEINSLIKTLEELISRVKGTQNYYLRSKLGKAYYLLADIKLYFDINDPDINKNYRLAMEAVPENPFYRIRVSEVFEDDKDKDKNQAIGIINLKKMGFRAVDYFHWFDERWVKRDKIISDIKDIHENNNETSIESKTLMQRMLGY